MQGDADQVAQAAREGRAGTRTRAGNGVSGMSDKRDGGNGSNGRSNTALAKHNVAEEFVIGGRKCVSDQEVRTGGTARAPHHRFNGNGHGNRVPEQNALYEAHSS